MKHLPRHPALPLVIWLLLVALTAGCSYFNAFYNTKTYFKSGEQERERSTDLNKKPAGYTKAVDAGARLIEYYPDSKYIDDALFIMGQSYYWLNDYHKALRKFEELQANYPESPHVIPSRLWVGRSLVKLKRRQDATSTLRSLISDTDDPQLVSGALFALAELYYDDSLFVKAEEEFAKITETTRDAKIIGESHWRAGESAFREKRYESAVEHLGKAAKYATTRSLLFRIQFLQGQALRESGRSREAISVFENLLNDKRYHEEHGKVRVQLALAFVEVDRIQDALNELDRVIETYPRSDESTQAYFEKGRIQLHLLGQRAEAKESFDKGRLERSRSLYAMRSDTLLNLIKRVDDLGRGRRRIVARIDFTQAWVADPVDPAVDSLLRAASYYDSLAFDSLRLVPLFSIAYRDSIVPVPVDSSLIDTLTEVPEETDSLQVTVVDSGLVEQRADSTAEFPPDTLLSFVSDADSAAAMQGIADLPESVADTITEGELGTLALQLEGNDTLPEIDSLADRSPRPGPEADDQPGEPFPGMIRMDESGYQLYDEMFDREFNPLQQETGAGEFQHPDSATIRDTQPTDSGASLSANAAPPAEIIRLFNPQPVLDSLAVMRVSLQNIRFQLGEVLLFDLNQPDSAKTIFEELANPPNADSVQARAILALTHIARSEGDSTRADSLIKVLADEYVGTRYGRYAAESLGRELPATARPDFDAFEQAEILYLVENKPDEAFTLYRWIVSTYPESPNAPKALYASAFLAGDAMTDPVLAEELLDQLARSYPRSAQALKAESILSALERRRLRESANDTTSLEEEFADIESFAENEVESVPEIIGDMTALASVLESRSLLPQEVIQGTGGEVVLRYIVAADGTVSGFRVVMEDPPGRGLARALIAGLEEVSFRPGYKEGKQVVTRVERRYTLPLDAPPNVRPLPRRRR